jgi:GNAT superfamily N-acetyltransferase
LLFWFSVAFGLLTGCAGCNKQGGVANVMFFSRNKLNYLGNSQKRQIDELMTQFTELTDVSSKDFNEAMAIYIEAIPATERHPLGTIKTRIQSGKEKLYIGSVEGKVVLMALLYPLEELQFVLLDYMAVKPEYRKQGLGSEFLKNIYNITGLKNRLFLLEVEDPKTGADQQTRQRRVYFYRKNGAKILKNLRYILPPLQGNIPTDMILLVLAKNRPIWLSGEAIKDVLTQVYIELYGRDETDPLLKSFIDKVPERVELG